MNIDPRTMQQLLQLKINSGLLFSSTDDAASTDDTGSFMDILSMLLQNEQTADGTENSTTGASSSFPLPRPAALPLSATAQPSAYDSLINEAASQYGVDASLIKAVMHAESSFNPYAVSSAGAKGLMQLMDGTAAGLGVLDSFDPQQNIGGGARFLSGLLDKYGGNVATALAAYNAGPGRIDGLGISNDDELYMNYGMLPQETQNYVRKVLDYQNLYE